MVSFAVQKLLILVRSCLFIFAFISLALGDRVKKYCYDFCKSVLPMLSSRSFIVFSGGSDGKESAWNVGDLGSFPGLGRSPGGEYGNPLQYSCLENPHGQRSLVGYSPWGCKELAMTERLSTALTFKSLIHFEFVFVYGVREYSNFIYLHLTVQFSQHHLLKRLSFPHCLFLSPFVID